MLVFNAKQKEYRALYPVRPEATFMRVPIAKAKARRAREMTYGQWLIEFDTYIHRIAAEMANIYVKEGYVIVNEDALLDKIMRYIYETSSNRDKSYHFLK